MRITVLKDNTCDLCGAKAGFVYGITPNKRDIPVILICDNCRIRLSLGLEEASEHPCPGNEVLGVKKEATAVDFSEKAESYGWEHTHLFYQDVGLIQAFRDGAEFGYNKGKEESKCPKIGQMEFCEGDVSRIPEGWYLCDGRELPKSVLSEKDVVDLLDKYGGIPDMRPAKVIIYLGGVK